MSQLQPDPRLQRIPGSCRWGRRYSCRSIEPRRQACGLLRTLAARSRAPIASIPSGVRARRPGERRAACPLRARPLFCCPRVRWLVRSLSPEEAELWAKVTATIRPLSREPVDAPAVVPSSPAPTLAKPKARIAQPAPARSPTGVAKTLQAATLDGSWDRRLGSGRIEPDRTLDLHGHSLDRAWQAIDRGLERSIAAGDRVLLLITGHRRRGEPPLERGRIRAAVHDWLAASRHASRIAAVRGAHRRHGGGGSLYIILRKG